MRTVSTIVTCDCCKKSLTTAADYVVMKWETMSRTAPWDHVAEEKHFCTLVCLVDFWRRAGMLP